MAPEHPDVFRLAQGTPYEHEVHEYVNRAIQETAEERGDTDKPKTGAPLGRTVTNPVNGEQIPMFVADYVLMEYGTGAIMAVPAHDERDFAFAKAFDLPIRPVVEPAEGTAPEDEPFVSHSEAERLVNSGQFSDMPAPEGRQAIVEWLDRRGRGHASVSYRLRDWLVSRQRYWAATIPIVTATSAGWSRARGGSAGRAARRPRTTRPRGARRWRRRRTGSTSRARRVAATRAARRHDGHVRRLVVVLPALLRRPATTRPLGPRRARPLDAGGSSTSAASSTRSCT